MAQWTAKVYAGRNELRVIEFVANSEAEAREHASRFGRVVVLKKRAGFNFRRPLTDADRQIFFTRLAAMLTSRVGTGEALALMRDTFPGRIQEVSGKLLSFIEAGDDLAAALGKVGPPDFPEATIAMIQAGTRSGETGKAVADAAAFEYELHQVKKGASKGLISGIAAFLFAGVTTVVSTVYVGPKIMESDIMKTAATQGGGIDIGWITTAGNILGYLMGLLLVIGVLAFLLAQVGRRILPVKADQLIMKIPFYKDLVLARNNYIVLYGLELLVQSGVRMEEALRLSAESAPKGALRRDLFNAAQAVKAGRQWPKVMDTFHPTDKAALIASYDREQVARTLGALARQYRELYSQRLASFVPLLNMLAAVFLSLAGGVLFGQSILPMLMASQNMLG